MPLLCSRWTQFLQSHSLGCLSSSVFSLFSDTAEKECWVVAVGYLSGGLHLYVSQRLLNIQQQRKNLQSLSVWDRSWTVDKRANISSIFESFRPRGWILKDFPETVREWRSQNAVTVSADTVASPVLSKTLCSPKLHPLFYQKEEQEGV